MGLEDQRVARRIGVRGLTSWTRAQSTGLRASTRGGGTRVIVDGALASAAPALEPTAVRCGHPPHGRRPVRVVDDRSLVAWLKPCLSQTAPVFAGERSLSEMRTGHPAVVSSLRDSIYKPDPYPALPCRAIDVPSFGLRGTDWGNPAKGRNYSGQRRT